MTIIDRYMLRQFVRTFILCYISLAGLYIVFDAFIHMEDFLRFGDKVGGGVGLLRLLGSYYGYRMILFFDRTSALLTLISAMFTVTWIQRHNELTALLSAGISRVRVVAPIIAAAVSLSLAAVAVREVVIPRLANELSRVPSDLLGDQGRSLSKGRYDNQTDIYIRGMNTYANQRRIEKPEFLLPQGLDRYGSQLSADNAYYQPPEKDRPGGYLMQGVRDPKGLPQQASLELAGTPVIITPRDAPWLAADQCFVVSDLDFDQLIGGQTFRQFSSTRQLIAGLYNRSLDYGADIRVEVHCRIVQPLLDVTLLFLGLPLVLTRQSRNVFLAIGLCLLVVALFLLIVIGFKQLGVQQLLRPALAAWAPLMLFAPLAVYMAESMWE